MHTPLRLESHALSARARWFMSLAWAAIAGKCVFVWWAVERWHMPFHPAWVVAPTLAFAALATALWIGHRE